MLRAVVDQVASLAEGSEVGVCIVGRLVLPFVCGTVRLKPILVMPVHRDGHTPAGSRAFASMQMFSGVRTISNPASSTAAAPTSTEPTRSGSNRRARNTAHPKVKATASVRGTTLDSLTIVSRLSASHETSPSPIQAPLSCPSCEGGFGGLQAVADARQRVSVATARLQKAS